MAGNERPRRGPKRTLIWAACLALLLTAWSAPALGKPCDNEKAKGKVVTACDDGEVTPDGSGSEEKDNNGNAYGHGNGNAYGHDKDEGAGGTTGGSGAGGNGVGAGGTGGGSTPGPPWGSSVPGTEEDSSTSAATSKGSGAKIQRKRKSTSVVSGGVVVTHGSNATPVVQAPAKPAKPAAVASPADWDVSGPQLASGLQDIEIVRGTRYLDLAVTSAEALAFPLLLMILVGFFLLIQGFVDRNDPKLRYAAVTREYHEFS